MFHNNNAHNRWFDKSLTVVVSNDGRLGLNGEHSPCDALVPSMLVNYASTMEPAKDPAGAIHAVVPVSQILWKTDAQVWIFLKEAQLEANRLIQDSDSLILHYKGYGSDVMKKYGKRVDSMIRQSVTRCLCANVLAIDVLPYSQILCCCV